MNAERYIKVFILFKKKKKMSQHFQNLCLYNKNLSQKKEKLFMNLLYNHSSWTFFMDTVHGQYIFLEIYFSLCVSGIYVFVIYF